MSIKGMPSFRNYGQYSSDNYGAHTLMFGDGHGNTFYFSYETLVAVSCAGGFRVLKNYWSTTTGKHLNWIDGGNKEAKEKRVDQDTFDAFLLANNLVEA